LGRRLLGTVAALGHRGAEVPVVAATATLGEAVAEISAKRFGVTAVVDAGGRLVGVITDGDVRRAYERGPLPPATTAAAVMTKQPKTVPLDATGAEALHLMESHQITALLAVDDAGRPTAVVHIHDLLGRGAATSPWE
jgi:arabinose-5-phosphate isomerase